jgi:hypothetical protein
MAPACRTDDEYIHEFKRIYVFDLTNAVKGFRSERV